MSESLDKLKIHKQILVRTDALVDKLADERVLRTAIFDLAREDWLAFTILEELVERLPK